MRSVLRTSFWLPTAVLILAIAVTVILSTNSISATPAQFPGVPNNLYAWTFAWMTPNPLLPGTAPTPIGSR